MRTLKRNQQKLYYAELLGSEDIYALDEQGNKIVAYVDNTQNPPVTYYEKLGTTVNRYSKPVLIKANIMQSNGDMVEREYGLSEGSYEAEVHKNCTLTPQSVGGSSYVDMPIDINFSNDKVHGTVDNYKYGTTVTFTAAASF